MNLGEIQDANLVFFLHDRWQPALADVTTAGDANSLNAINARMSVIESFLWLHLGTRLHYFPSATSRRVVYEDFRVVLKAYEKLLADAQKPLDKLLSKRLKNILDREFRGESQLLTTGDEYRLGPLLTGDESLQRLARTVSFFQTVLILGNGFARNPKTQPAIEMLSLAHDDDAWRTNVPPLTKPAEVTHPRYQWAVEGVSEIFGFMQAYRQIRDDARAGLDAGEFKLFVSVDEAVRDTQGWRLNFGNPRPRERFLELANLALELVLAEATEDSRKSARAKLKSEALDLMRDWGAELSQVAGGSGS